MKAVEYNPVPPTEVDTDYSGDVSEVVWSFIMARERTHAIFQYIAETGVPMRKAMDFVDEALEDLSNPTPTVGATRIL